MLLLLIAERNVRRRQLTDDGNIEISGRDLRERKPFQHIDDHHSRGSALAAVAHVEGIPYGLRQHRDCDLLR